MTPWSMPRGGGNMVGLAAPGRERIVKGIEQAQNQCDPERTSEPTSPDDQTQPESTKRLLARVPVVQNACDLDLIVFLHRHPRALLTTEQLAGFVGYNLQEVAKALDCFIGAGLLVRTTQQSMHAARMFVLLLGGPQGEGLRAL